MEPVIAIIYDCDDTLCRDATDFLLEKHGIDVNEFWLHVDQKVKNGWDPPLAYLTRILELVRKGALAGLTKSRLREIGSEVELYPGLPQMFKELDRIAARDPLLREIGLRLEHYIISCGIAEIIRGLNIARYMTEIYGCEFEFDPDTGVPVAIKSSISFTEKTKFIFAINKNISGRRLRHNPYSVNDIVPHEKRRIPFENMIYVGDGPSDIPCFAMITYFGGDGVGVAEKPARGYQLAKGKRTTIGPYSPDYRSGSDMRRSLEAAIRDKAYGIYIDLQQATRRSPTR